MPAARMRATLSRETYADLLRAAPVALLVMRVADLVMVEANQRYLDAVGLDADAVLGRHVFDVFPNSPTNAGVDQATDLRTLFEETIARRTRTVVEGMRYDIPAADGFDVRWWNVVETPVLDAAGEVAYLLHFTEDVTDLRHAQADLAWARSAEESSARLVSSLAETAFA